MTVRSPLSSPLHPDSLSVSLVSLQYGSQMAMYRHIKTGALVMSCVSDDENKCFGVTFRTPPADSKGIPHILEHSVLCGSRKYPIKEPFNELMKGSVNTFLNAMTFPDRTAYPVASCNLADFYNLVDVYLDAVLHPKCVDDELTFKQEGWHLELNPGEEEMTLKGVVFNEMKGVYSQPDSVFYRTIQAELFPDNTYGVDSGGDPQVIPDLTFAEFRSFHQRYYHPSNARFWFYGDDAPEKRLELLAAFLDDFEPRAVDDSKIVPQPLWTQPRQVTRHFPIGLGAAEGADDGADDGADNKAFASVNWVLSEGEIDLETQLALGFLDYLLTGTSASPLRKTLNDSGLGSALVGGGLDDDLAQPIYAVGLKGVDPAQAQAVHALVVSTLERLAEEGFPASAVEAAINTIEFSLRENNTGSFPRGLSLMFRAMSSWIYDRNPYESLVWEEPLARFKARLERESTQAIFGGLIRKFLLNNNHRVDLTLLPDAGVGAKLERDEADRIQRAAAAMNEDDRRALAAETEHLRTRQETPDDPEALKVRLWGILGLVGSISVCCGAALPVRYRLSHLRNASRRITHAVYSCPVSLGHSAHYYQNSDC